MRNRKVRDLGQSEEDSLEATSKSSDGSKSSTSSSACTFSLSGQTLGNGSSSPALQGIKEEEQQQQLEQDQERALLSSMERALGGADEQQQQQQEGAEPPKRCSKCNKKLGLTGDSPVAAAASSATSTGTATATSATSTTESWAPTRSVGTTPNRSQQAEEAVIGAGTLAALNILYTSLAVKIRGSSPQSPKGSWDAPPPMIRTVSRNPNPPTLTQNGEKEGRRRIMEA